MKKVIMIVVLSLLLKATYAEAIDYTLKGSWIMSFGYGENGRFQGAYNGHSPTGWGNGQDNFEPVQKLQFKFEAVVSENLSGKFYHLPGGRLCVPVDGYRKVGLGCKALTWFAYPFSQGCLEYKYDFYIFI